ncbi:oligopeptide ABC transporter ATP-binding protein [Candidatus Epulonipiscioides saccharophilum]|nr:oligopeptide ABC transporter ATP-binding protein [Epulopiscium sp. SCG-B10WGA-EpuloB]
MLVNNPANNKETILSLQDAKVHFKSGSGKNKLVVKAVDGVNFEIYKGEIFGLVGESGCGKTTTGRAMIRLNDLTDGKIEFLGQSIAEGTETDYRNLKILKKKLSKSKSVDEKEAIKKEIAELKTEIDRKKKLNAKVDRNLMQNMQMIFQDPIASLDPRMTVKEIIAEGLRIMGEKKDEVITQKVNEMLKVVGLVPEHGNRYPHEFSGGQRQRIGIARALILNPKFLIADEPISALDVSIQAQIINLLNDLRDDYNLTILFVAHDLSVVKYFSDRIGVMYFGHLVELAESDELFANPIHPYTKSLLSAVPLPDPRYEKSRTRIIYDAQQTHDYTKEQPRMHEIKPGHFVRANTEELDRYRSEL